MSDLGNKEVFAKNLKRLMTENDLTRSDVAKIVSKPYSTVSDLYNAKTYPRIDMIEKLANYFKTTKAELIESSHEKYTGTQKYLMGHSTARLALEVYTHVSTDRITADRLNGVKTGSNEVYGVKTVSVFCQMHSLTSESLCSI